MVGFHEDAICLSGITGTRLKSEVISRYYRFWWNIVSGGEQKDHKYSAAIIELNAGTGEIFIEDTAETILGSAGHALQLKFELDRNNSLKVIVVENDGDCYPHLKNVIKRQFPEFSLDKLEGPIEKNTDNVFLFNLSLENALEEIDKIDNLGNALFFFDPLRMVEWKNIEQVAKNRIRQHYGIRTEFIIFLFTSDYFLGRKSFASFPTHTIEKSWTLEEMQSISESDALFGNILWRNSILNSKNILERENDFINLYKNKLHRWFRYVIALPFNPKEDQLYHLIYCSNYEAGVRKIKNDFLSLTRQEKFNPENKTIYSRFIFLHPELASQIVKKNQRPLEWKILWKLIMQEDGIRDRLCPDLKESHPDITVIQRCLDWLLERKYLETITLDSAWYDSIPKYQLNWSILNERLRIPLPPMIRPLSSKEVLTEIKEPLKTQSTLFDGF
jgi:three-Cys-motif partner protein